MPATPSPAVHPVDERLPTGRLTALGLQHVLVMYAGAVAGPLIVGRALKLSPEQVTMLIQADLFCCGLVTLIQALGATQWFGIRLPVMMGVTFASVAPMVAMAGSNPGVAGAGLVMFGMVAATGIRILAAVDYKGNRNNLFIVAVSIGVGMIPLIAPRYLQWLPHGIHPLIESGILLASISAVALNLFFNGSRGDERDAVAAAKSADAH